MQRYEYCERLQREIYGEQPRDDASISINLINSYLDTAIGVAAKQNYRDTSAMEGVGYVNNSFYTTFKGLAVSLDESFLWKITLPQIPFGIGANQGVSTLVLKDSNNRPSLECVPLTENQRTYYRSMKPIPNKTLYYTEGTFAYIISTLFLNPYTATVTMMSGGDRTDLTSTLNVPADYIPILDQYIRSILIQERHAPKTTENNGEDDI